jgi:hypothetical protein
MYPELARVLIVLALVVALGIWMHSFLQKNQNRNQRRRHWVNGLLQPAVPLQPAAGRSQPMDTSKPAVPLAEAAAELTPQTQHLIGPGSLPPAELCSQPPLLPGCLMGQQWGGMTISDQTIYPNSYLPAAVYNTSGFVPGCDGFGYAPDPCWQ